MFLNTYTWLTFVLDVEDKTCTEAAHLKFSAIASASTINLHEIQTTPLANCTTVEDSGVPTGAA
jgi:hypothetical protein